MIIAKAITNLKMFFRQFEHADKRPSQLQKKDSFIVLFFNKKKPLEL